MAEVLILLAHPELQRSRVNRAMIEAVATEPSVRVHDLYERYPDFNIDIRHEKLAIIHSHVLVFQHPMQWYGCPSLMKEWLDVVLQKGWAYGSGSALKGKKWLSAVTTGTAQEAYSSGGTHGHTIESFLLPFERTAQLCGMRWQAPLLCHDALRLSESQVAEHAASYRTAIRKLAGGQGG